MTRYRCDREDVSALLLTCMTLLCDVQRVSRSLDYAFIYYIFTSRILRRFAWIFNCIHVGISISLDAGRKCDEEKKKEKSLSIVRRPVDTGRQRYIYRKDEYVRVETG